MTNYRPFSVFRPNDYRTPRTMREAFGDDQKLHLEEPEDVSLLLVVACLLVVLGATVLIVQVL